MGRIVRIIGVPMDLGQSHRGVDMGPSAIRYADLAGTLRDLGVARDALEPAALAASTSSSMKANPVSLSGEQLLEMLEAAWE